VIPVEQTTFIAVLGLVVTNIVTIVLTLLELRETRRSAVLELRETERSRTQTSWHESSSRLASPSPAERAVGMAAAVDYLQDAELAEPARRVTIDRLHYEDDPLIVYRGLQALSGERLSGLAVDELLVINRQVWRHLLEEFAETCLDTGEPATQDLESHIRQLGKNRRTTSQLLQVASLEDLDFSNAFYPDLRVPARRFTGCNFSSSLLHYSNFRDVVFEGCDFSRCVLVGSYLEGARFRNCTMRGVIALAARLHQRPGDDHELPAELVASSAIDASSYIQEAEQDWYGQWLERAGARGRPWTDRVLSIRGTTTREFSAEWFNLSGGTRIARMLLQRDGTFVRKDSDDRNNGIYRTTSSNVLDRTRRVALVGGTRTLTSGVPSAWSAIWWQQLRSRPTQTIPITPRGTAT
jgi:hypothetical protein